MTKIKSGIQERINNAISGNTRPKSSIDSKEVSKSQIDAVRAHSQALERISYFKTLTPQFNKITSEEQYLEADNILGQIQSFKKWWEPIIQKPIKYIRAGLEALYELNREVTRPIEAVEKAIKDGMRNYKLEEARIKREVEQELERKRLELEARVTKKLPDAIKVKVQQQIEEVQMAQQQIEEIEGVSGFSSHTRLRKIWEIVDMYALIKAVARGEVPQDVLTFNKSTINAYWKQDPDTVSNWPGVISKDDITVAHGRRYDPTEY
jgi:hypothetical protein